MSRGPDALCGTVNDLASLLRPRSQRLTRRAAPVSSNKTMVTLSRLPCIPSQPRNFSNATSWSVQVPSTDGPLGLNCIVTCHVPTRPSCPTSRYGDGTRDRSGRARSTGGSCFCSPRVTPGAERSSGALKAMAREDVPVRPPRDVVRPVTARDLPAKDYWPGTQTRYEVKADGWRTVAGVLEEHCPVLYSRQGGDLRAMAPEILAARSAGRNGPGRRCVTCQRVSAH